MQQQYSFAIELVYISSSSKHQNIKTSTNHNSDMTSYNEKRAGGRIGAT
jgi:hypothetical protein